MVYIQLYFDLEAESATGTHGDVADRLDTRPGRMPDSGMAIRTTSEQAPVESRIVRTVDSRCGPQVQAVTPRLIRALRVGRNLWAQSGPLPAANPSSCRGESRNSDMSVI